jgi:hypothetical protein
VLSARKMMCVAKSMVLATFVLVATGPSYAEPLGSTPIPASLADDEKRLMPKVMTKFYGSFDKEKACWISSSSGPSPLPAAYRWGASIQRIPSIGTPLIV